MSYITRQFAKLGNGTEVTVKIQSSEGETYWLPIDQEAVMDIMAAVLKENERRIGELVEKNGL